MISIINIYAVPIVHGIRRDMYPPAGDPLPGAFRRVSRWKGQSLILANMERFPTSVEPLLSVESLLSEPIRCNFHVWKEVPFWRCPTYKRQTIGRPNGKYDLRTSAVLDIFQSCMMYFVTVSYTFVDHRIMQIASSDTVLCRGLICRPGRTSPMIGKLPPKPQQNKKE